MDNLFFRVPHDCASCGKAYKFMSSINLYYPDCNCLGVESKRDDNKKIIEDTNEREEMFKKTLIKSKIPKKYYKCTLENIDQYNVDFIASARSWLNQNPLRKSFFVYAEMGTGKSLINSIMGHECIKKNKSIYFTNPIRIYNDIFNPHVNTAERIDFLKTVDVLIIDDITKGVINDWHRHTLFDIVDERYGNELVSIMNTNEKENDVERKIGLDTIDRIREMCGEWYLKFNDLKKYRI